MRERERNGVRMGQAVRDLDGASLGRVVRLYDWGFQTRRGFFGREFVLRYDELRALRDGALVVSRSARDLLDLAAGAVPRSWRIPTPLAFPTAATPSEARDVREAVAAGRVSGAAHDEPAEHPAAGASGDAAAPGPLTEDEVRAFVETRGQGLPRERARSDRG